MTAPAFGTLFQVWKDPRFRIIPWMYLAILVTATIFHYAIAWKFPTYYRGPDTLFRETDDPDGPLKVKATPGIPPLPTKPDPNDPAKSVPDPKALLWPIITVLGFFAPFVLRPYFPLLDVGRYRLIACVAFTGLFGALTYYVLGWEKLSDCAASMGTSFYFNAMLMTTTGFGGIYPAHIGPRLIVAMEVLLSIGCLWVAGLCLAHIIREPGIPTSTVLSLPRPTEQRIDSLEDRTANSEKRIANLESRVEKNQNEGR